MQTFKKRNRVVTPDGLGHVVHVYMDMRDLIQDFNVRLSDGKSKIYRNEDNLRPATSKDFKKGKAEIWKNHNKKWSFRLKATNGKQIGGSYNQQYANRVDMIDVLNNNHIDFEIVQK